MACVWTILQRPRAIFATDRRQHIKDLAAPSLTCWPGILTSQALAVDHAALRSPSIGLLGVLPSPMAGFPNISSPAPVPSQPPAAAPGAAASASAAAAPRGSETNQERADRVSRILGPAGKGLQALLCCELKAGMIWHNSLIILSCNAIGQPVKVHPICNLQVQS